MKRAIALVLLSGWPAGTAWGAPPTVDYVFPAGAQKGAATPITFGGKVEAGAQVWCDRKGVTFKPGEKAGEFTCEVAKDAEAGPCLLRVYNDEGVSAVRQFVVGEFPEANEKEPNDAAAAAMTVEKLPAVLNGQLEKSGDVDSFRVNVAAGEWLVAKVESRVLGSPVDATVRVLDAAGTEVAFGHDDAGLDPLVAYRAEAAGTFVVQVSGFAYPPAADVRFTGSKACGYRLTMTTGPWANYTFPAGVARGGKTAVHVYGWNLPGGAASVVREVDTSGAPRHQGELSVALEGLANRLRLPVSDLRETAESEPNDHMQAAQVVEAPCVLNGRISRRGDLDRFAIRAKKGEKFSIACRSASLGFPMDAAARVEDPEGKQLASNDDGGERQDAVLAWTAPADGAYHVVVTDLMRRGGEDFVYRLDIARPTPGVEATAEAAAVVVTAGGTAELKVNVARKEGHDTPLAVVVKGLPVGVAASAVEVPKDKGPVTVTLAAATSAKPWSGEVRVLLVSLDEAAPMVRSAAVDLRPKEPANELLVEAAEGVWLTVREAKKQ